MTLILTDTDRVVENSARGATRRFGLIAVWAGVLSALASTSTVGAAAGAMGVSAVLLFSAWLLAEHGGLGRKRALVNASMLCLPMLRLASGDLAGPGVPLEGVLLQCCLGVSLIMLGSRAARLLPWAWGLLVGVCVVSTLFISESFCVTACIVTCVIAAATMTQRATNSRQQRRLLSGVILVIVAGCASLGWLLVDEGARLIGRHGALPISGGDERGSEAASSGVGDGPDVVRGGENARSTGFDQSDVFTNSNDPSLYDVFVESFGEPAKNDKTIALRRPKTVKSDQDAALDLRKGKQFETRRSAPHAVAKGPNSASAMFWVDADQSQHIPLRRYDVFDGNLWRPAEMRDRDASLQNVDDPTWFLRIDQTYSPMLADGGRAVITIGKYGEAILPLPAFVHAFNIGKVNKIGFFQSTQGDLIRMRGRTPPAGTTIVTRQRLVDLSRRESAAPVRTIAGRVSIESTETTAARLADEWTAGLSPGWQQVDAITEGLKRHAKFERTATTPAGESVVEDFLNQRVGAAYHFATAAAVMLRHLGYDARLVVGFYADANVRDPRSNQMIVQKSDGHAWCEIRTAGNAWITLDPTPGHVVAVARQNRFAAAAASMVSWAWAHWPRVALGFAGACGSIVYWRHLADVTLTLWFRCRVLVAPTDALRLTARLIDGRAKLWRCPRRNGQTLRQFIGGLRLPAATRTAMSRFLQSLEQHLYGTAPAVDGRPLARIAARTISRRALRASTLSPGFPLDS